MAATKRGPYDVGHVVWAICNFLKKYYLRISYSLHDKERDGGGRRRNAGPYDVGHVVWAICNFFFFYFLLIHVFPPTLHLQVTVAA